MEYIAPTWEDVHLLSLKVAKSIIKSNVKIDVVVGILRGGWIVAKLLSDALNVENIGCMEIKFYTGIASKRARPIVTQPLILNIMDKNVLLVDDVADSGRTLSLAMELLKLQGPNRVLTATLYVKPHSIILPDFYAETTSAWIIFPWEIREVLEELAKKENVRSKNELLQLAKRVGISESKVVDEICELMF